MAEKSDLLRFLQQRREDDTISLADERVAAKLFDCSLRKVEETALNHSILPRRYRRNGLSCRDQLKLLQTRVAIIGCGGLGGRTAELLARLGIGSLSLTDPDTFSESNLNRQNFCTTETLGCHKAEVLAHELQKINPILESTVYISRFGQSVISTADIVIDGLDSTEARRELSRICQEQSKLLIHGAVKGWYGQAGVEHSTTPLITTLYPETTASSAPPKVLPMTVSLIAAIQAAEACKLLLGHASPLTHGWLQCDLLHCDFDTLPLVPPE